MPDLTANRVQELTFTIRLARNTKAILFNTHRSWSTDQHATIEDLVAEGDKVACRWSGRATHQGDLMGVAATGKAIVLTGIAIYRVANGKIQEEWDYSDVLGLMQQLGVGPL